MRAWPFALSALVALIACAPTPSTPTPPPRPMLPLQAAAQPLPQPTIGEAVPDSPEWPVLGFLRGWQQRDWGAMALSLETGRPASDAMAAQYDFRPLRGAQIVVVDKRSPSLARVTTRVWYEFPAGRVQRKRLDLMVSRTDAPRTPATGPSPWRVNQASAAAETDDP